MIAALLVAALLGLGAPGRAAAQPPRRLMIVLDAVPYSTVAELTDPARGAAALFQGFKGPVPLISTFPSSTSVALTGLLESYGLERSPGYEARFFDWQRRRVRGGGPISYFRVEFAWRRFFDVNRRGVAGSMLEAVRPVRWGLRRLEKAIDDFAASDQPAFSIYIAATDTAAHLLSPDALAELFEDLDRKLGEVRGRLPAGSFEVVIFSDHGMAGGVPLRNVWRPLRRDLREAGYRYRNRLRGPRDVVLTPYGLVSSFEAYVEEASQPEVAGVLAAVGGVDFCVYRRGAEWVLRDRAGEAVLWRRPGRSGPDWSYRPASSDPLGFAGLLDAGTLGSGPLGSGVPGKRQGAKGEGEGWATDDAWFEASLSTPYPDAFHRLARAFELVENPASILCSLAPGHMFGARRTELASRLKGRLKWTHGALERDATLGFLMSDVASWEPPAWARFDRALLPFRTGSNRLNALDVAQDAAGGGE